MDFHTTPSSPIKSIPQPQNNSGSNRGGRSTVIEITRGAGQDEVSPTIRVTASRDGNDRGHDTTVTNLSDDAAVRQAAAQNYAIVTVTENYWDRSFDINGLSITKTEAYGKTKWVGLTGLGNIIDWGLKRTLNLDFEVKMQKTSVFELYSEHSITTKYRF